MLDALGECRGIEDAPQLFSRAKSLPPPPAETGSGEMSVADHGRLFLRWVRQRQAPRGKQPVATWAKLYHEMCVDCGVRPIEPEAALGAAFIAADAECQLLSPILPAALLLEHEAQTPEEKPHAPTPAIKSVPPKEPRRQVPRKHEARAEVLRFRHPMPQADLPKRWGVSKSMVSQWLNAWEAEGIVHRSRVGRCATVWAACSELKTAA